MTNTMRVWAQGQRLLISFISHRIQLRGWSQVRAAIRVWWVWSIHPEGRNMAPVLGYSTSRLCGLGTATWAKLSVLICKFRIVNWMFSDIPWSFKIPWCYVAVSLNFEGHTTWMEPFCYLWIRWTTQNRANVYFVFFREPNKCVFLFFCFLLSIHIINQKS